MKLPRIVRKFGGAAMHPRPRDARWQPTPARRRTSFIRHSEFELKCPRCEGQFLLLTHLVLMCNVGRLASRFNYMPSEPRRLHT
jgi:hypothetical protein